MEKEKSSSVPPIHYHFPSPSPKFLLATPDSADTSLLSTCSEFTLDQEDESIVDSCWGLCTIL